MLATVGIILTTLFVVEVVMKNIAFTPRGYLQSRRNRYDLFVTVFGVMWIFIHYTFKVNKTTLNVFNVKVLLLINILIYRMMHHISLDLWL